jgi:DNA-binding MarR family transcriptional regulator
MSPSVDSPPAASSRAPDSLVIRTLLTIARQRSGLDETGCQLVLEWLQTGVAIRGVLRKSLALHGLTELKFSILVALFSLDPIPAMEADLANHARAARPSVTRALEELEQQRLVARAPSTIDHRVINVKLTRKGQTAIDAALHHYLLTAGNMARLVEEDVQAAACVVCTRLRSGAASAG